KIPCVTSVPTNVAASAITPSTADVAWDAVPSATYDLRYRETGTTPWTEVLDLTMNTYTISGLDNLTEYEVQVRSKCSVTTSAYSASEVFTTLDSCLDGTISTFPYTQGFENNTSFTDEWKQGVNSTDDDIDWTRDSGGTPSANTGPTTGSGSTWYIYTEASTNVTPAGSPRKSAIITSDCIDFTGWQNARISFDYHMYGADLGSATENPIETGYIALEVSDDDGLTFNVETILNDNSQNTWKSATNIDLSAYDNKIVLIRFRGVTGSSWGSDMALDNINIDADPAASDPPVAVCQNITVQLDNTGNATIVATDVDGGSSDDVAITDYGIDIDTFDCTNIGTPVDVTLTVTDAENQTDSCVATVTVVDQIDPEFVNVPSDITLTCGNNQPNWVDPSITDNCGGELVAIRTDGTGLNSGDVFPLGVTTISYSATDNNGNTNTASFNITVVADNEDPSAFCQNITVQLDASGNATITAAQINNESSDNCGIASIAASQTTFTCADEGANNVTLTVTDTSGNTDTCTAVVTVTLQDEPATLECWETATYNYTTCEWDLSGTQPTEPTATNCWDDYQFNDTTCEWENQGTEPLEPAATNCWDDYQFDNDDLSPTYCTWVNQGTQPIEPTATNCWDDYQFNNTTCEWENQGIEPTPPTGLSAGSITATGATISWDAMPSFDFDLRYRQLGSPTWIDILDITTNSQALATLTSSTEYEVEVRSKCSATATSGYATAITFITLDDTADYCDSTSTNSTEEYISNVELNTIDNASGAQDYSDFTSISTVLRKGNAYTITITPAWAGTVYNEAYSVWIDYNGDGDFEDSGEQVFTQAPTQNPTVSGSFTIPATASVIKTRMRVSMKWNGIPTSCETFTYGEVEDYTVILVGFGDLIYTSSAWTPYAPSPITNTDNAFVLDGTYNVTDDIQINDMTVCDGAGIVIEKAKSLTVNGALKTADNVVMESDSDEYASLIVSNLVVGTAQYKRHVNATASVGGNDLIAPPVFGESFMDFRAVNPNILSNTANTLFLFGPFDKVTGTYELYTDSETAPLEAGVGYRAASTDASTFTFTGLVKMGDVNSPVVISGPQSPEWNLIGNPYTSYIKLSDFLSANNSKFDTQRSGIYGYDGNATDGWTIWNQAYSDANPNAKITPGQGFLIATATNPEEIVFTPSMRSIGSDDDFILGRESNNTNISHLKLEMSNVSNRYHTDFYFTDNASLGLDHNYDSGLFGTAPGFSIYSHLVEENQGRNYGVQSIGNTNLSDVAIPLGVHVSQGQQVTIRISETTLNESTEVYLEDVLNNTFTLLNTSDYTFTTNTNVTGTGRFFLRFAETTLSTPGSETNTIDIYATTQPKTLYVKGQLLEDTQLAIHDIQGRLIKTMILSDQQTIHRIDVSSISTGVYIVSLKNGIQERTEKVVIK
ncbi:GEVED domain-containing protein, partial [Psychroserpens sp. SPM9]|uniref:GEVED domain-containing protein n=1 Tax=Psychroserpens sp. SPM9 TaxID=2975598 RepID=UPI0021A48C94